MAGTRKVGAETVAEYLAAVPPRARAALQRLRRTIRAAAPKAEEVISYGVPTFRHRVGLVAYAAFEDHCTFFIMSTKVTKAFAADLKGYPAGRGSIRFPAGKPLPAALVKKLVKARIAENEARGR